MLLKVFKPQTHYEARELVLKLCIVDYRECLVVILGVGPAAKAEGREVPESMREVSAMILIKDRGRAWRWRR